MELKLCWTLSSIVCCCFLTQYYWLHSIRKSCLLRNYQRSNFSLIKVVNDFRDKPVSFMWAQAGDHQELQDQFNLNSGFPSVILINPLRRVFSIMRSSFTEENFEEWLKDILNRKGGRKFGQYSKSLVFGDVSEDNATSGVL